MKIYNLTFCDKMNYGAMLQCFAIQRISSLLEQETIHLELVPKFSFKTLLKNLFPRRISMIYHSSKFIKNRIKNVILKQNLFDFLSNELEETVLLVGSDQVWNPLINDNQFLCDFSLTNIRKRSYACSLGYFEKGDRLENVMSKIQRFENISVRESDVFEYFKSEMNHSRITCDLDPTLLMESSDWIKMSLESKLSLPKHYILVFGIYWSPFFNEYLKKIQATTGFPIVSISEDKKIYCTKNMYGVSPIDFLAIISKADYVITSSYHGACFSIIFQRPFCALINPNMPSRISSLLRKLNMENRAFDVPTFDLNCDFDKAIINLNELKLKSLLVFKDAISK